LAEGKALDGRSDLYSFGVVLYEMMAGRPPFEGPTPEAYLGKHLHSPPPPLDTSRLPARSGTALSAIVRKALEKDREKRFASARGGGGPARRAPPGGAHTSPPRRSSTHRARSEEARCAASRRRRPRRGGDRRRPPHRPQAGFAAPVVSPGPDIPSREPAHT